jgi:hypothetical protein
MQDAVLPAVAILMGTVRFDEVEVMAMGCGLPRE